MPIIASSEQHAWWTELRHRGLVIAPALLDEFFPGGPQQPDPLTYQRLRQQYATFDEWYQEREGEIYRDGVDRTPLNAWLDSVLGTLLGHGRSRWQNANYVDAQWKYKPLTGELLSPRRVLFFDGNERTPALFVWVELNARLQYAR